MTAIRHALQKDIFEPDEERLLSLIHVSDAVKKKKTSFLCLTVTTHHPVIVRVHEIRKADRGDVYKKKRFWLLRDLKVIDGINPRKVVPEFEVTAADKLYKWLVTNPAEKDPFIKQLWKLCNRFIPAQKPDFVNISLPVEELELVNVSATVSVNDGSSQQGVDADDYKPISAKEEEDFRHLLQKANTEIGKAEKFYDQLTKDLSVLDSANIQAIMGSEMHLAELMNKIDSALEEATALEKLLESYDEILLHVREGVEMMEEKDSLIHTHTSNRKRLIDELHQFLSAMDLSANDQQVLNDCNLTDPSKINRCTQAAISLQNCMKAKIPAGYEHLKASIDQVKLYTDIRDRFAERLVAHLTALFRNLTAESPPVQGLTLARHDNTIYLPLKPFSDLVLWLKTSVPQGYKMLLERYVAFCKDMYKKEFASFFEVVKQQVRPSLFERKSSLMKGSSSGEFSHSNRPSLNLPPDFTSRPSLGDVQSFFVDKEQFKKLIDTIINQIEPVIQAEQKFCIWFFHVVYDISSPSDNESVGSNDSGTTASPEKKLERQYTEQIKNIMGQLFESLDWHLQDFIAFCDRTNSYYSVHLMALLSDRALAYKDTASYLSTILGKIVVIAKRRFDVFMESQVHSLGEAKLTKRTRVGIIPNLNQFEELARETELAFQNCQRRGDLDRWYPQIVLAVCQSIESIAADPNSKSPPSVVRMENYHRLFSVLSQLKISSLEPMKKDAKQNYQTSLDAYVKEYMGKPMEKLQNLFDQIEVCIEQGMKPEAIAYQQNFSKQELKKAIAAYPGKEVKKGLEQLYKKVEKNLCDEENLLQVVWRNMQDEFIQQYKHYEQLIGQCYPNSNVQIEFGIQEVLAYFSDIAQQH